MQCPLYERRGDNLYTSSTVALHPARDLPDAEFHLLDTGHFALEDKGDEIAKLMLDFLDRKLPRK